MNKQEYEQAKKIVEDAEKIGATHYDLDGYMSYNDGTWSHYNDSKSRWVDLIGVTISELYDVRQIQDLKTQIALYERVQELEGQVAYTKVGYTNFNQLHCMIPNEFSQDTLKNDGDAGLVFQTKDVGDFEVYVTTEVFNKYQDELKRI